MFLMPLVMLLPLLALPIFWILPLGAALPIYVFLVALSAVMFRIMRRTMKLPPITGKEHLVGKKQRWFQSLLSKMLRHTWCASMENCGQPKVSTSCSLEKGL